MVNFFSRWPGDIGGGKEEGGFLHVKNAYWSEFVPVLTAAFSRTRDALLA